MSICLIPSIRQGAPSPFKPSFMPSSSTCFIHVFFSLKTWHPSQHITIMHNKHLTVPIPYQIPAYHSNAQFAIINSSIASLKPNISIMSSTLFERYSPNRSHHGYLCPSSCLVLTVTAASHPPPLTQIVLFLLHYITFTPAPLPFNISFTFPASSLIFGVSLFTPAHLLWIHLPHCTHKTTLT